MKQRITKKQILLSISILIFIITLFGLSSLGIYCSYQLHNANLKINKLLINEIITDNPEYYNAFKNPIYDYFVYDEHCDLIWLCKEAKG